MEEDHNPINTSTIEIQDATGYESPRNDLILEGRYLFSYCAVIILLNLFFMYIILRNNLNRSPFYLVLLHVSIFGTVYTACGVLSTTSFGIPNYSYHIFTNSKHIAITFETILFTTFIFDWFLKSEHQARNIIVVFWIVTVSFIFLGSVAVSCGDRLFYSFYITTFLSFTILLVTFVVALLWKFRDICADEKRRNRMLLVLIYLLCFLPNYLLLMFDVHLYYYYIVDFICPILMYGHSLINIIFIIVLDGYLRLHFRKACKRNKIYRQNSHFPVDNVQ